MVSRLESGCSLNCLAENLDSMSMSSLLNLSSLGRICGSGNDVVVLDRVKRKNSVRRMSIIEDGEIAEVLYLIPKQSMMEQLPFLNPNDYILCEKLASIPAEMSGKEFTSYVVGIYEFFLHDPKLLISSRLKHTMMLSYRKSKAEKNLHVVLQVKSLRILRCSPCLRGFLWVLWPLLYMSIIYNKVNC